jgi:hypothetical protein
VLIPPPPLRPSARRWMSSRRESSIRPQFPRHCGSPRCLFWRRGVSSAANGVMTRDVGSRFERTRRALTVTRVAQRSGLRRVLAEIGVRGHREATRESARNFRLLSWVHSCAN